ncbi:Uncharacterised protein [Klebsiella michiganensis]|uniref:Uncharacterized protein n=1 Tax=Klebsiella michiganensis TaxID=1134687 RepID=A0A7H4N183_9ENTR|nr:Uncharacterised protein [Klebsiella michiganensis]
MDANDHHAFLFAQGIIEIDHTFHVKPFLNALIRSRTMPSLFQSGPSPSDMKFCSISFSRAAGDMVGKQSSRLRLAICLTAFQEAPGCATGAGTDKMQDGIRKLDDEPEHAQAKPGPPNYGDEEVFY